MENLTAKDRESIYERIVTVGTEHLTNEELLAGIVGCQIRGISPDEILTLGFNGLVQRGFTSTRALAIVSAIEFGRRAAARPLTRKAKVESSRDIDSAFRPRLAHCPTEHFYAIPLDVRNRPMGEIRIASGSISTCPVGPADIFRPLIRDGVPAVIFVHNHPSGEPNPSADDVALTDRLCRVGEILGIRVLDHVIIAADGYFSFLDAGLMGPRKNSY